MPVRNSCNFLIFTSVSVANLKPPPIIHASATSGRGQGRGRAQAAREGLANQQIRSAFCSLASARVLVAAPEFRGGGRSSQLQGLESLATSRPTPRGFHRLSSSPPH